MKRSKQDLPDTPPRGLELKLPPPVIGLLVAGSMWLASSQVPAFAFVLPGRIAFVLAFAAAGGFVDFAALLSFRRARTTVNPLRPHASAALVTSGIYRFTRNPMYLGMLLLLLAWGLWLSNALSLALPALFVCYMNRFQIGPEERALSSLFGQDYLDYRQRVRRWL